MKNRKEALIVFTLFVIISSIFFAVEVVKSQDIPASMQVVNTPPKLIKNISDIIWPVNTNCTRCLNLREYFLDDETNYLNFSASVAPNVSILIDEDGFVSFYPDFDFEGVNEVIFNASDSIFTTPSNLVKLKVLTDLEPPTYDNISVTNLTPYQNDYITLHVDWSDNIALKDYTVYINQNGNWSYFSNSMTGLLNYSEIRIQVSAPPNSYVYWFVNASDAAGNNNQTPISSVYVSGPPPNIPIVPPTVSTPAPPPTKRQIILSRILSNIKKAQPSTDFILNPTTLLVELKHNDKLTRFIQITNNGPNSKFTAKLRVPSNLTSVIKNNFELSTGETYVLPIEFFADDKIKADYYENELIITSEFMQKSVPIGIIVRDTLINFTIRLDLLDPDVASLPDEDVKANITIINSGDNEPNQIRLTWSMRNFKGDEFDTDSEDLSLQNTLVLTRSIHVPANTPKGEYIFIANVKNQQVSDMDAKLFTVGEKQRFASFLLNNYLFILIIILAIISAMYMTKYNKDSEKNRLLNLYVAIQEMQQLLSKGRSSEALVIYKKIKAQYHESLKQDNKDSDELLKKEMNDYLQHSDQIMPQEIKEKASEIKGIEDKSKGIEDKSKGIEDKSKGIEDKSKGIEDKSKGIEDKSKGIEDKSKGIEDKSKGIEDKSKGIEDKSKGIEDKSKGIEDKSKGIEDKSKGIEDKSKEVKV